MRIRLLLILSLTSMLSHANNNDDISKMRTMLFNYQFAAFDSCLSDKKLAPEDSCYLKATKHWIFLMANPYNENYELNLKQAAEQLITKMNLKENTPPKSYLLTAYGYSLLGRICILNNKWRNAYRLLKKAMTYSQKIPDDNIYHDDALFPTGLYHYYVGMTPGYLKMITFFQGLHGNKKEGLEEINQAIQTGNYMQLEASFFKGLILVEYESEYKQGIQQLLELKKISGNNVQINMLLAKSYIRLNQNSNAIQCCQEAIATNRFVDSTEKSELHTMLGFAYQKSKRFNKALEQYHLAEYTCPDNKPFYYCPWKHYNIATCYENTNNINDALVYYHKVLTCIDAFGFHKKAEEKIENHNR